MGKTRIVLDTNILISSFGWEGNPKKIFDLIIKGDEQLIISSEQFEELSEALDYPKFDFSEEQKSRFKSLILKVATMVYPQEKVNFITDDPDDNTILEAALAGKADYIITGDSHLLDVMEFRGIKIVPAKEFIEKR